MIRKETKALVQEIPKTLPHPFWLQKLSLDHQFLDKFGTKRRKILHR